MTNDLNRLPAICICDAIMGSGKTSAAISYMNAHPQERFIFISPLLSEDDRIVKGCPDLKFARPGYTNAGRVKRNVTKSAHFLSLVHAGRNIATTHALFDLFTDEMYDAIQKQGYTAIIDEEPPLITDSGFTQDDLDNLEDRGAIHQNPDGTVDIIDEEKCPTAKGKSFDAIRSAFRAAKNKRLLRDPVSDQMPLIWTLPNNCFACFRSVIMLTYMFEASILKGYLLTNGFTYEKIYVNKSADGQYTFTNHLSYLPEYMGYMSKYIHIYEGPLNAIGDDPNALSATDYDKMKRNGSLKKLRPLMRQYFIDETGFIHGDCRMWSTFKKARDALAQNGWISGFLACNVKATNSFANRYNLAYMLNVYMHPSFVTYMAHHGLKADQDGYALSTLVQWIWRSAIRNGCEIYIFIPSSRMRNMLKQWIADCEQEYKKFYDIKESA